MSAPIPSRDESGCEISTPALYPTAVFDCRFVVALANVAVSNGYVSVTVTPETKSCFRLKNVGPPMTLTSTARTGSTYIASTCTFRSLCATSLIDPWTDRGALNSSGCGMDAVIEALDFVSAIAYCTPTQNWGTIL